MNTLSEQLTSLYESKWDKLMQQLDKRQIKTQCPFVLSVQRNGSEDWYAGAQGISARGESFREQV